MIKLKIFITSLFLFIGSALCRAQDGQTRIGTFMRSEERSYVVVAVMLTILAGLIIYMIRLERRISRMEKEK
jgi:hypothetical protein